jgi:PQQ-like domain
MCIRQKLSLHKMLIFRFFRNITGLAFTAFLLFGQTGGSKVFALESVDSINLEKPLYIYWRYETPGEYKIASDNAEGLYLVNFQNVLIGLNSTNGLQNWETPIGGRIGSEFFIYKGNLIQLIQIKKEFTGKPDEKNTDSEIEGYIIRSTNKLTGITNWQIKIPPTDLQGKIYCRTFEDKFIIVTTTGNLISLNNSDGSIVQRKNINSDFTIQPFFDVSKFYIIASNNRVSAISYADFTQDFEARTVATPTSLLVSENLLIWGDKRGFVSASSLSSIGKNIKWRSRKGGEIVSLTKTSDGILAASTDNYIYLMSEKSGDTIWKKRLASRTAFEPTVSGNYVIVSTLGETEALVFDLKSGKTINRITLSDGNFYTAAPVLPGRIIVFQTSEGLIAYSNRNYSTAK